MPAQSAWSANHRPGVRQLQTVRISFRQSGLSCRPGQRCRLILAGSCRLSSGPANVLKEAWQSTLQGIHAQHSLWLWHPLSLSLSLFTASAVTNDLLSGCQSGIAVDVYHGTLPNDWSDRVLGRHSRHGFPALTGGNRLVEQTGCGGYPPSTSRFLAATGPTMFLWPGESPSASIHHPCRTGTVLR